MRKQTHAVDCGGREFEEIDTTQQVRHHEGLGKEGVAKKLAGKGQRSYKMYAAVRNGSIIISGGKRDGVREHDDTQKNGEAFMCWEILLEL